MPSKISEIKDLDPGVLAKLQAMGMKTVSDLVEKSDTPKERADMAKELGLTPSAFSEIINRADLARLTGVGPEMANLLENCGIDSCKELSRRVASNLYEKMKATNEEKKIAHRAPSLNQVEGWVKEAKELTAASKPS